MVAYITSCRKNIIREVRANTTEKPRLKGVVHVFDIPGEVIDYIVGRYARLESSGEISKTNY